MLQLKLDRVKYKLKCQFSSTKVVD